MKIKFLFFLFFLNLKSNIFLQKPQLLSESQIKELMQNWKTEFVWKFGYGSNFVCC